jgi:polyisoprenyl-phosphate glycosyltransferase
LLSYIMSIRTTLTAVVPAYNEGQKIGNVLEVLRGVERIDDLLVIDDGSRDMTVQEVLHFAELDNRIRLISHPKNLGKGQTFFTASASTRSTYLLTLDADLINLNQRHIQDLILPVLQGKAEMTTAVFKGGQLNTDLAHQVTPWLSGQRCFRTDLLKYTSQKAASGYGIETAITIAARQRGWRCQYIPWQGVTHPSGEKHRGFFPGLLNRIKMYLQIIRALILTLGWKRAVDFVRESRLTI